MKNPYKLYEGESLDKIVLKAIIVPFAPLFHTYQFHKEKGLSLSERIKNYLTLGSVEILKLGMYAMLVHNSYELIQKYLS